MINLIHGDDISASRVFFTNEKNKFQTASVLDGTMLNKTELTQLFEGTSMFGNDEPIFIENFLGRRKASKEVEELATYIASFQKDNTIYIWEGKELTKKQLGLFPGAKNELFKLPTVIFTFLDSIKPNNSSQTISLFHQVLMHAEPEFVLFMLERQIRLLLALRSNSYQLEELARMSPWQKNKLQSQASMFALDQLSNFYQQLYAIDKAHKTGQLTQNITNTIDFFLSGI